jgi:hypothetical protein
VTRESYFGVDGKPEADKDGVFEVRTEYDKAGKVIRGAKIYAVEIQAAYRKAVEGGGQ